MFFAVLSYFMVALVPLAFCVGVFVGWTPARPKEDAEQVIDPRYSAVLFKYLTVGQIAEMFGEEGASKDPKRAFYCDPFWMQWQQLQMQEKIHAASEKILDEAEKKGLL